MASSQPDAGDKKRRGLGRLLGKRDKTPERPATLPDSAYASSEPPTAEPSNQGSTSDMVPAEKDSEIANIDKDKNLALKPSTGEVFDQDTGEVITVVTTTTTTTTTTTRKPGQTNSDIKKDVQREVSRQAQQDEPIQTGPSEMPANSANLGGPIHESTHTNTQTSQRSPPIPLKSNKRDNRKSAEIPIGAESRNTLDMPGPGTGATGYTPPGSPQHNFSYPSRGPYSTLDPSSGLTTSDHPMLHDRSTVQDLKAAAKGIHGVGETLRGTLNSTIDRRFPARDAEKAALINAKNDQVLARGRTEIEGLERNKQRHNNNNNAPIHNTQTSPPTLPGDHHHQQQQHSDVYSGTNNEMIDEDESQARRASRDREKASTIGKLFKRKPVGGQKDELRVTNP